jgi:hypothetical protein
MSRVPGAQLTGGTSQLTPFSSVDQAQAYMFERIQTPHVALALFDPAATRHWPNPVRWTKSDDPAYDLLIAQRVSQYAPARTAGAYGGATTTIGTAIDDVRTRAQSLANKRAGRVIGVIHTPKDNLWHALGFNNEDDADDWINLQTQDPAAFTYAAYFDKSDATWPHPVIEKIGGVGEPPIRRGRGTSRDWVGAAFDDARKRAAQLATAASGNAAGAIRTANGLWHSLGFRSLDDAIDWLQAATTDKANFTYAAAFEKSSDGTAYVQQEEFGGARVAPAPGPLIRRGIATTSGEWWAA